MSRWLAAFRTAGAEICAEPEVPETPRKCISGGNGGFGRGVCASVPLCAKVDTAEVDRLLAAGRRAVLSPDALGDAAEVMIRGELL